MYTKIRLLIKKNFPSLYLKVRNLIFPQIAKINSNAAEKFIEPTVKSVKIHGINYKIQLNPQNGFVDTTIYTNGVYEPDILLVIKENLPVGGTFIDVGANIGNHTLFAAKHVGSQGQIVSFEPIPHIAKQLEKSIELNNFNNVTLHQFACSDSKGEADLILVKGNIGGSSLHRTADGDKIKIMTNTADSVTHVLNNVDLIKIDAEGHELEVLKGLSQTIDKNKPNLIIEFSPSFWGENSTRKSIEFFNILLKYNYKVYDLEVGHQEIMEPLVWLNAFNKQQTNLLCKFK